MGNLPYVNPSFFNTHAVMEEYGTDSRQYSREKGTGKHLIPQLNTTHATDFNVLNKKNGDDEYRMYPAVQSNNSKERRNPPLKSEVHDGIPWLQSNRTMGNDDAINQIGNSNRSNFFPSFDSRGNVGIIGETNEFTPTQSKRKFRSNLNAGGTTSEDRGDS